MFGATGRIAYSGFTTGPYALDRPGGGGGSIGIGVGGAKGSSLGGFVGNLLGSMLF